MVLSAPGARENFWHLIFDSLPKIKLLEEANISLNDFDSIIVDQKNHSAWKKITEVFNVSFDKLLESRSNPFITAENIIYVSLGYLLPPDKWALDWLNGVFSAGIKVTKQDRKIYISRRNAKHRRFEQEDIFYQKLKAAGFERIEMETLTLQQQIEVMRRAKAVIAPHGAGLTNLVWCRPGTKIVELFGYEYVNVCYWNICNMLQLRYAFAIGERKLAIEPRSARPAMDHSRQIAPICFKDIDSLAKVALEFTSS